MRVRRGTSPAHGPEAPLAFGAKTPEREEEERGEGRGSAGRRPPIGRRGCGAKGGGRGEGRERGGSGSDGSGCGGRRRGCGAAASATAR